MMTRGHKIAWIIAAIAFTYCGYGWLQSHDARLTLQTQMQADVAASAKIAASETVNKQQLVTALSSLANQKQIVQTPTQIVRAVPTYITLPQPIHEVTAAQVAQPSLPDAPHVGDLVIPAASAKSFFDAQIDCRANATKLLSCQQTATNDMQLMDVKDTEIKQLNQALKGGTKWQRTKTALKWTGIGLVVGAVAVEAANHK